MLRELRPVGLEEDVVEDNDGRDQDEAGTR